ncbi:uncharacterized protein [Battus philenor]|uniref:uncharacterized protein n=1 Tax=Battus philenor TaxID=42288 RepID=UPI0035D0F1C6
MSGYLEVKYPFKSNLGLNPFKSWKRQWCILRPSATCGGGSLAVYCSEAGASAGTVDLPSGCVVKRAKSRTRPHAFAVFSVEEPCKPRVLLAAPSHSDAQLWMDKIRNLLNSDKLLGDSSLKDTFSVTVTCTELSKKCGLGGADCSVSLSGAGLLVAKPRRLAALLPWDHLTDARLDDAGDRNVCVLTLDSGFNYGSGVIKLSSPLAGELVTAVRSALGARDRPRAKLSRSEGDLRGSGDDPEEVRRSSWYSGPSEISLDDTDLIMSKEARHIPSGPLALRARALLHLAPLNNCGDTTSDRRSLASVSSGVYEEISEEPAPAPAPMSRRALELEEPTYESVADCIYATVRRGKRCPPPPLPPRHHHGTLKLGESWSSSEGAPAVTRHSSLGSLPRCCHTRTLPKARQPFSVFRKRLKSDSRIAGSPKSENAKEIKDVETKKKKFDFPPPRDIFKSFKVSRKMKNLKITSGLAKGETKSCEFLDDTHHVTTNRCSKSVECLEGNDDFDGDVSLKINDDGLAALALPQEIVELILRGRDQLNKIRLKDPEVESDYMPMSPIVPPPPIEHHYIVMSPRTNLA